MCQNTEGKLVFISSFLTIWAKVCEYWCTPTLFYFLHPALHQRHILLIPHSQQNLAASMGYLDPHEWQNLFAAPPSSTSFPLMPLFLKGERERATTVTNQKYQRAVIDGAGLSCSAGDQSDEACGCVQCTNKPQEVRMPILLMKTVVTFIWTQIYLKGGFEKQNVSLPCVVGVYFLLVESDSMLSIPYRAVARGHCSGFTRHADR